MYVLIINADHIKKKKKKIINAAGKGQLTFIYRPSFVSFSYFNAKHSGMTIQYNFGCDVLLNHLLYFIHKLIFYITI